MKNITVALEEDVARWARIWAAEHDSSVSRMLGDLLKQRMRENEGYDAAMQEFLSVEPCRLRKNGGRLPTRDEIHERE